VMKEGVEVDGGVEEVVAEAAESGKNVAADVVVEDQVAADEEGEVVIVEDGGAVSREGDEKGGTDAFEAIDSQDGQLDAATTVDDNGEGGVAEVKSEVEVVPGGTDTKEEVGADKSLEGARVKTQRERSTRQHRERTPKPTTAAQKFRHDQKMAAEMAKMPLSDIKDAEARRREEAWRKMEEELPSTEVDTKCLARGSSDFCFKNWMKTGSSTLARPGSNGVANFPAGIKAYQHAQAQMAALMHKRNAANAASTMSVQRRGNNANKKLFQERR